MCLPSLTGNTQTGLAYVRQYSSESVSLLHINNHLTLALAFTTDQWKFQCSVNKGSLWTKDHFAIFICTHMSTLFEYHIHSNLCHLTCHVWSNCLDYNANLFSISSANLLGENDQPNMLTISLKKYCTHWYLWQNQSCYTQTLTIPNTPISSPSSSLEISSYISKPPEKSTGMIKTSRLNCSSKQNKKWA